jgi:hypothetical protein
VQQAVLMVCWACGAASPAKLALTRVASLLAWAAKAEVVHVQTKKRRRVTQRLKMAADPASETVIDRKCFVAV